MMDAPQADIPSDLPAHRPGPHRVALMAAALTWPLLFLGGLVTTYKVGMAVPDWPSTFGENMFLYDFTRSAFGVVLEHSHRLLGAGVGLAAIALAVWFTRSEPRRWVVGLGWVALLGVIVQGLLGGFRVRLNSTMLAAVHGCSGQAVFGLLVFLCVLTGRSWREPKPGAGGRAGGLALGVLALVYAQVVAGAWLRHFGSSVALIFHGTLAAVVVVAATTLVVRVARGGPGMADLIAPSRALAVTLLGQVMLGLAAWWTFRPFEAVTPTDALIRTGHQANAALVLASAVVLAARAWRAYPASRSSSTVGVSVRPELEAVA